MKIKSKKAMTLIELIIVIGILAVIMGAISIFFISNYNSLNKVETKADLQHAAQRTIDELSQAALNSTSYEEYSSPRQFIFTNNTFQLENNEFKEDDRVISSTINSIIITQKLDGKTILGINIQVTAGLDEITETIETEVYFRNNTGGNYSVQSDDITSNEDDDGLKDYDYWEPSKTYSIGNMVKYYGIVYKSKQNNNKGKNPDKFNNKWEKIK